MALGRETLDFGLEGAVELVGIDLFIFEELVVLDATTELFGGEEIVIDAILLGATRGTRGAAYTESKVEALLKQITNQRRLAAAAGCGKNDQFAGGHMGGGNEGLRDG